MLFSPLAINTVDTVASPHSRGGMDMKFPSQSLDKLPLAVIMKVGPKQKSWVWTYVASAESSQWPCQLEASLMWDSYTHGLYWNGLDTILLLNLIITCVSPKYLKLTWDVRVYSSYNLSYSRLFSWNWVLYSCNFFPTASILSSLTTWSWKDIQGEGKSQLIRYLFQ